MSDDELKRKIENSLCLEYKTYYIDYIEFLFLRFRHENTTKIFGDDFYKNNYKRFEIIIDNKIIDSNYYTFEREVFIIFIYI